MSELDKPSVFLKVLQECARSDRMALPNFGAEEVYRMWKHTDIPDNQRAAYTFKARTYKSMYLHPVDHPPKPGAIIFTDNENTGVSKDTRSGLFVGAVRPRCGKNGLWESLSRQTAHPKFVHNGVKRKEANDQLLYL